MPWVLRLSMTSTTVSASGESTLRSCLTWAAQSRRVRWVSAWTRRHPARGSTHTKIEQVPQRTYSLSSRWSCPGLAGIRVTGVVEELVGLLVHADHRTHRVIDAGVDRQHVFHPGGELRVRPWWDGPALLQMRTQFRFFKTRPMVE